MEKFSIKNKDIIAIVQATAQPPENINFENISDAHNLAKNKHILQPIYDGLQLANRPAKEFRDYQKQAQKLQLKYGDPKQTDKLREELHKLTQTFEAALDAETKRREDFEAAMDKVVDVELTPINFKAINGNGKDLLKFLSDISPVLDFSNSEAAAEKAK